MIIQGRLGCEGADRECEGRQSTQDMVRQQDMSTWAPALEQQRVRDIR